jgi:hypothetical protein
MQRGKQWMKNPILSLLLIEKLIFLNCSRFHVPLNMDLLIRAVQDRLVQGEHTEVRKLWESMEAIPAADHLITTHLEHSPGKQARDVFLAVRWQSVQLLVPAKKKKKYEHASVTFTALLITQVDPPEGETPLEWLLLTSLAVETFQQAAQCVLWYRLGWLIERYHFVVRRIGACLDSFQRKEGLRVKTPKTVAYLAGKTQKGQ